MAHFASAPVFEVSLPSHSMVVAMFRAHPVQSRNVAGFRDRCKQREPQPACPSCRRESRFSLRCSYQSRYQCSPKSDDDDLALAGATLSATLDGGCHLQRDAGASSRGVETVEVTSARIQGANRDEQLTNVRHAGTCSVATWHAGAIHLPKGLGGVRR
jgi:hypothetical protein